MFWTLIIGWKNAEAANIQEPLLKIRESASTAIEEFEKVVQIKKNTRENLEQTTSRAKEIIAKATRGEGRNINEFIDRLALLRASKGEMIALRDLRYVDVELVQEYEEELSEISDKVSQSCVRFLLRDEALEPYINKVSQLSDGVAAVTKVVDAKKA